MIYLFLEYIYAILIANEERFRNGVLRDIDWLKQVFGDHFKSYKNKQIKIVLKQITFKRSFYFLFDAAKVEILQSSEV